MWQNSQCDMATKTLNRSAMFHSLSRRKDEISTWWALKEKSLVIAECKSRSLKTFFRAFGDHKLILRLHVKISGGFFAWEQYVAHSAKTSSRLTTCRWMVIRNKVLNNKTENASYKTNKICRLIWCQRCVYWIWRDEKICNLAVLNMSQSCRCTEMPLYCLQYPVCV